MTDPAIAEQQRQAAALGPTAALRQQNPASQRETLISRRPGTRTVASERAELERRRRELDLLALSG